MLHKITEALIAYGPLGLFVLAFLDSTGIPVGAGMDALLLFLAVKTPQTAWWCAGMAVVGSMVGNLLLFSAAKKGGQRFLETSDKPGRAQKFAAWFRRYGLITVFIPAFVPFIYLPLKLFVISAGALHTPRWAFVRVILLARVLRYFGEVLFGSMLGNASLPYLKSHVPHLIAGALLLGLMLYAAVRWSEISRARERVGID